MPSPSPILLPLPQPLADFLAEKDALSDDIDLKDEGMSMRRRFAALSGLSDVETRAVLAEITAFHFSLDKNGNSVWGTRFGHCEGFVGDDGCRHCFPDISQIDGDVIGHWTKRAGEIRHPVLKARYADLVWDLSKAAIGANPPIGMARQAVDAYVECGKLYPRTYEAQTRLERAIELALLIGDKARFSTVLSTMFDMATRPDCGFHASWLLRLPSRRKGVSLSEDQQKRLVEIVEKRFEDICKSDRLLPPTVLEHAEPLADYYDRLNRPDDKKRVLSAYGQAICKIAEKTHGFVAVLWLNEAYGVLVHHGLKEEAEPLLITARAKSEELEAQMVRHRIPFTIANEKRDAFVAEVTKNGLQEALRGIAINFCPTRSETRKQIEEAYETYPIFNYVGFSTISGKQTIHQIGSIDDDLDGCLMFQLRDNMTMQAVSLRMALEGTKDKCGLSVSSLLSHLYKSPIFDQSRIKLVEQGLEAYFSNDHVKAVHVLVPQIEHCLRMLLGMLGKATVKHGRSNLGIMMEKSLNDILESEKAVLECLGEDITFYLRFVLCDSRGYNLRNNLAHGLMEIDEFNGTVSDRLIHVLLLLALIQESKEPDSSPGSSS